MVLRMRMVLQPQGVEVIVEIQQQPVLQRSGSSGVGEGGRGLGGGLRRDHSSLRLKNGCDCDDEGRGEGEQPLRGAHLSQVDALK